MGRDIALARSSKASSAKQPSASAFSKKAIASKKRVRSEKPTNMSKVFSTTLLSSDKAAIKENIAGVRIAAAPARTKGKAKAIVVTTPAISSLE